MMQLVSKAKGSGRLTAQDVATLRQPACNRAWTGRSNLIEKPEIEFNYYELQYDDTAVYSYTSTYVR
jgi:hypothetical protein